MKKSSDSLVIVIPNPFRLFRPIGLFAKRWLGPVCKFLGAVLACLALSLAAVGAFFAGYYALRYGLNAFDACAPEFMKDLSGLIHFVGFVMLLILAGGAYAGIRYAASYTLGGYFPGLNFCWSWSSGSPSSSSNTVCSEGVDWGYGAR